MKYIDILKKLEKLKVFSVQDIKNLDDKYEKSKISKWKQAGYIRQVIRGYYLLAKEDINNSLLFKVSNTIYSPSYISLESAFAYYSIIPEQVFSITCVSTKKTTIFQSELGTFEYKKIKGELYFGYDIKTIGGNKILIASLEKALLDYFYLNDTVNSLVDLEYLRFNREILREKLDRELLKKYSHMLNSKIVKKRADLLIKYIEND